MLHFLWLVILGGSGGGGGGGGGGNGPILAIFLVWKMDPKHVEGTSILVPEIIPESVGHV